MNPPPSLYSLALQQCLRYGSFIDDIGDTPYILVKPILAKLPHEQLAALERRSPHIAEQSDELWRDVIVREFRDRKIPRSNYRATFYRYCRDKEDQLDAARERLKLTQEQFSKHKREASVIAISESELPPSQRGAQQQQQPSFRSRHMQSVARRAQASAQLRRPAQTPQFAPGVPPRFGPLPTRARRYTAGTAGTVPLPGAHPAPAPPPPPPPAAALPPSASSRTPVRTATGSLSATAGAASRGASPLRAPPMKRRKVPSVFLQRK